ncbi:ATP-binding protein [Eubacterium xylanophilum]|uniref:ATP-binding protein n=1 Tax=Eubacterium xylanophilum TaxID=39497 RepID=UPI0004B236B6|nr:ATP-binding protein [Eubacterium xylanophilum]
MSYNIDASNPRNNPYTLTFGKQPFQNIPRVIETNEIVDSFLNTPSTHQVYMITGVHGSGKTVLMTEIKKELDAKKDWECIELSTSQDLLLSLCQTLYEDKKFSKIVKKIGGISAMGFGVQLNSTSEMVLPQIPITEALKRFKKAGKKLLVCIDEIIANDSVKEFSSIFQILIRDDLPIYLIMTGLYENISNLMNEKNLTFLYRAPQIKLKPLNLGTISENYRNNLNVSLEDSEKMAQLTKGYSFAFQVLGYFTYKYDGDYKSALREYQQYLEDCLYEKIWSELSRNDKKLLYAIATSKTGKASDIKKICNLDNNKYTPYRDRLLKKMIVNGDEYGYLKLVLPMMENYIVRMYRYEIE